jgi:site-specific recombinase XerC
MNTGSEQDRKRRPSTLRDYRNTANAMLRPGFGDSTPLDDVTALDVEAFRVRLVAEAKLSPRTINKALVLAHGIFKWAVRRHGLRSNPVEGAERQPQRGDDDRMFCGTCGEVLGQDLLRRRFKRALKAAGLKPMRLHDLRRTFGTLAVQAFPMSDVKAMMGHADVSTTMIYVHHVPQTDAAARLSALLETGDGVSTRAPTRGLGGSESATSRAVPTA